MSNSRRKKSEHIYETFWFTIDDWYREYSFGINHHPWEMSPGHYDEHDTIIIVGQLRNKTRRKFTGGELHLLPSQIPRSEWSVETDRIGNVWGKEEKLCCSAWIQSEVFYSLTPVLAEHRLQEMVITVCDLRYKKGRTEYFRLHHEASELEDE